MTASDRRPFCIGLSLAFGAALICSGAVADPGDGEKMMLSAAVILSDLSSHVGQLEIDSADKAHFHDGSAFFRRLSDCRYTQFNTLNGPPDWYEIVDFGLLTGNYHISQSSGVQSMVLEGSSPETRCFSFGGRAGCQSFVKVTVGPQEQTRVIEDLKYLFESCPEVKPKPF